MIFQRGNFVYQVYRPMSYPLKSLHFIAAPCLDIFVLVDNMCHAVAGYRFITQEHGYFNEITICRSIKPITCLLCQKTSNYNLSFDIESHDWFFFGGKFKNWTFYVVWFHRHGIWILHLICTHILPSSFLQV